MTCLGMRDPETLEILEVADSDRTGLISVMLRISLNISLSKIPSRMTSSKGSLGEKRIRRHLHLVSEVEDSVPSMTIHSFQVVLEEKVLTRDSVEAYSVLNHCSTIIILSNQIGATSEASDHPPSAWI